jgi:hypothetical protein
LSLGLSLTRVIPRTAAARSAPALRPDTQSPPSHGSGIPKGGGRGSSEPRGGRLELVRWVGFKKLDGAGGQVSKGATSQKKFGQRGPIPPTSPPSKDPPQKTSSDPTWVWRTPAGQFALKRKEWPFPGLLACPDEHAQHLPREGRAQPPTSPCSCDFRKTPIAVETPTRS